MVLSRLSPIFVILRAVFEGNRDVEMFGSGFKKCTLYAKIEISESVMNQIQMTSLSFFIGIMSL